MLNLEIFHFPFFKLLFLYFTTQTHNLSIFQIISTVITLLLRRTLLLSPVLPLLLVHFLRLILPVPVLLLRLLKSTLLIRSTTLPPLILLVLPPLVTFRLLTHRIEKIVRIVLLWLYEVGMGE